MTSPDQNDLLHANNASVGLLHPAVASAISDGAARLSRPNFYERFYRQQCDAVEATRVAIASLMRVDPACICLTSSTSHGIALLLNSLALSDGDIVAVGHGAFVSVDAAVRRLELRIGVQRVSVGREDGLVVPSDLDKLPNGTKVVLVDWVNYWSGLRNDIDSLTRWCRSNGIPLLVDGVQGIGTSPFDFDLENVAGLATGCHKWLRGPEGTGFVYIPPWMLPALTPIFGGYRSLKNPLELEASQLTLSTDARQFEVGTISHLNFAALGEAVQMYLSEGYRTRVDQIHATASAVIDLLQREPSISIATPLDANRRGGIVSFSDSRFSNGEIVERLREHGIVVGTRHGLVRLSAGSEINTQELTSRMRLALAIR